MFKLTLFFLSSVLIAQDDGLKAYQSGDYEKARKYYESILEEKDENAAAQFGLGTTAFQQQDLQGAIDAFHKALETDDKKLQAKVFYNLGNTHFKLGEAEKNKRKRIALWDDSAAHFAAATKLNTRDTDAASNLQFVKSRLKEEKYKLYKLTTRIPLGKINQLKQQDVLALTIFPPTPESMPKDPYWRMLVLDEYANGVGSTSASLLAVNTEPHKGMHKSHFGGRAPPADEKLNGEWEFHFEPYISKHLPLPGPFESVTLPVRRVYRFNEPTLFGHLEELPAKQVRYRVMFPADTRHIAPAAIDAPLQTGTPVDLKSYPGTTLALNLTRDEMTALNTTVQQVTGGQTLSVEKFTEAAIKFLHEHHAYTLDARIPKNSREGDPVLRWLRSETPGHCEYYAYSFQLMARAAGHPTRVIVGLHGAEFLQKEKRHVAKLSNLHAWNEIFDGTKWVRVEPTLPMGKNPQQGDESKKKEEQQEQQQSEQSEQEQREQQEQEQQELAQEDPEKQQDLQNAQAILDALKKYEKVNQKRQMAKVPSKKLEKDW